MANGPSPVNPKDVKTAEEFDELLKRIKTDSEKAAAAMGQMASALKGTAQATDYQNRATRSLIKGLTDQIALIQQQIQANQGNTAAVAKLTARLQVANGELNTIIDKTQAQARVSEAAEGAVRNLARSFGIATDASSNFIFQLASLAAKAGSGERKLISLRNVTAGLTTTFNTLTSFMEQGFLIVLKKGWDISMGLENAQAQFAQTVGLTTGRLDDYKSSIEAITYANLRAGVTSQQVGEAFGTLYSTVTNFTHMSQEAQRAMSETISVLMQSGTSAQHAAQSMQMLNKVMNQSGSTAAQSVRQLDAFARSLGVPPRIVQQDFAEMSMDLAVYGDKMISTFQNLSIASKETGISMNRLMSITAQFDTFEGAANAAGRLNAVLGKDLFNSLDMLLTTDPTARFRKLRQGIEEAAGAFEQMEYYERRAIASAAGLEGVGELALLMSRRLETGTVAMRDQAMTAEAMADQQMALMSLQQRWNATLQQLAPYLGQLMSQLVGWVKHISDNAEAWKRKATTLVKVWGALKLLGAILPILQTGMHAWTASATAAAGAATGLRMALIGGGMLGGVGLVVAFSMLARNLFTPQHSPSLYDGLAALPSRLRRNAAAARDAATGLRDLSTSASPLAPAMANALSVVNRFQDVDTHGMNKVAGSIRNIAGALNEVDVNKSLQFRASVETFASHNVARVVNSAVQLSRDDVQKVTDLVEQANKLSAASRVSQGDELSALVRSVAQIAAQSRAGGTGGGGGGYAGPENVEVTLNMHGSTLARQVVPMITGEINKQLNRRGY